MENNMAMEKMGYRIARLRREKDMTQEQLAIKSGYRDKSAINKIEKGLVDLPQSKIYDIAEALGVTPADIMGWETSNNNYSLNAQEAALIDMFRQLDAVTQSEFVVDMSRKLKESKKENALLSALQIG